MAPWADHLAALLLRTSIALFFSAVVVQGATWLSRPRSIGLQRALWLVVLLQGIVIVRLPVGIPWYGAAPLETLAPVMETHHAPPPTARSIEENRLAAAPTAPLPAGHERPAPVARTTPSRPPWAWLHLVVFGWLGGVILLVPYTALRYLRFVRRIGNAAPADAAWCDEWRAVLAGSAVKRSIPLVLSDAGPALCLLPAGYRVVVPATDWGRLTPQQRRAILRHELAHYERGDLWKSLVARLLALVHWFNPAAWWSAAKFQACAEWACDDVAAAEFGATAYARHLMRLGGPKDHRVWLATSLRSGRLFVRIRRLLSQAPREDSIMKKAVMISLGLLLAGFGALRIELVARGTAPAYTQGRDAHDDPLPEHALVRLGTRRLRHRSVIRAAAFSPDGAVLASASVNDDTGIRLWDARSGKVIRHLKPSGDRMGWTEGFAFSPDGTKVAAAEITGMVRLWDAETGHELFHAKNHEGPALSVAFAPDGRSFATGGEDGTVRIWNVQDGQELYAFDTGNRPAAAPRKSLVPARAPRGSKHRIGALSFTSDGHKLLAGTVGNEFGGSAQARIFIWDVATRKSLQSIDHVLGQLVSLAVTPDGKQVITGGNRTVPRSEFAGAYPALVLSVQIPETRVWDIATGKLVRELSAGDAVAGYGALALSKDGKTLVTGSDQALRVWDVNSGKPRRDIAVPAWSHGWGLALSPDGKTVAAPLDYTLGLWDTGTGTRLLEELDGHRSSISEVLYSPNGKFVATASLDGTVRLWNAGGGSLRSFTLGPNPVVTAMALSPDGETLAAGGPIDSRWGKCGVKLFSTRSGELLDQLTDPTLPAKQAYGLDSRHPYRNVDALEFSSDGALLAVAAWIDRSNTDAIDIWNVRSGKKVAELRHEDATSEVLRMAFSPDNRLLYEARKDAVIRTWNIAEQSIQSGFVADAHQPGEKHPWITAAVFPPDHETIVTSGAATLIVWDLAAGKALRTIPTPGPQTGRWMGISPDGRYVATSELLYVGDLGSDTIRMWDLLTGRQVYVFEPQDARATCFAFSPDNRRLASGTDAGTTLLWDCHLP